MKRIRIIILVLLTLITGINAQNADDALRYSQVFYGGTARYISMGGAFTALGADLSAISLNPASTGVYRSSEFSLTPQLYYNNTSANWNSSAFPDFRYMFNLNQIGVVSNIISTGHDKGLVSLNGSYSFNRTNNFNENITISGISDNSSIADSWVSKANGYSRDLIPDDSWAAYNTMLIDTLSGFTDFYGTIFSHYGDSTYATYGQHLKRTITNEGFTGEHAFSIGANYSNMYYFGATLGISTLRYTGHYEHIESDVDNQIYDFKNLTYTDHLEASGTGFSLKIGTIIKPVEFLRIGLALHSPVIYRINEYYYDNVTSTFDTKIDNIDHYEYSNGPYRYKYTLITPFRINTGVAVQIKKIALISADYEYVDYSMAQFSKAIDDQDYSNENKSIKEIYKSASNLRFGGEIRFNNLYLRTGYSYYGKAYKPDYDNKDLNYNIISFGIGMRQQNFYFDLAYSKLYSKSAFSMYYDPDYLRSATIESRKNTYVATLGFKF